VLFKNLAEIGLWLSVAWFKLLEFDKNVFTETFIKRNAVMKKLIVLLTLFIGIPVAHAQNAAAVTLPKVSVTASDSIAFKNVSSGAFTVYRDGTNGNLSVSLVISGTASNGVDIAKLPDSVVIPAGLHAVSLAVQPLATGENSIGKSVQLTLSTNIAYEVVGHSHATVKVLENAFEDSAPTVAISSPAADTSFPSHASISITADANDPDGDIAKVSILANDHVVGQLTEKPYTIVWTNVSAGKYALFARAEDKLGKSVLSAPVHITVTNVHALTTLTLTTPKNGTAFQAGTNIKLEASTGTNDALLKSVSFYDKKDLLGTVSAAPFSLIWSNVPAGSYHLEAKGIETSGASTVSKTVTISVTNPAPKVSIIAPANDAVIGLPNAIAIKAEASAVNTGVASVMFFSDNRFLGTVKTSPYTYVWTNATPGKHTLLAKVTDQFGETAFSSQVRIVTTNAAPVVSLVSPANGATFTAPAKVELKANAEDSDGIRSVYFYNGKHLIGSNSKAPYTLTLSGLKAGTYIFSAEATDAYSQTTTSSEVKITVTR
jgi:hypothetical protein